MPPAVVGARAVLNRLKWESGSGHLRDIVVRYRHRGAPRDEAALRGEDLMDIGRSFLDLPEGVRIPHHRILRIEVAGRVVWDRTWAPLLQRND